MLETTPQNNMLNIVSQVNALLYKTIAVLVIWYSNARRSCVTR